MPGAGKSSCIDHILQSRPSLPTLYFGGITIDEVKRRGLEVNEANERIVREDIRAKEGKASHAKRIAAQADGLIDKGHARILVDGLYSWSEYKFFKEKYGDQAIIVAITAPRNVRHERLAHRPVRPLTDAEVSSREYAEIENMEKGGPIANADYTLVNAGEADGLYNQLNQLLAQINF
jgi:dephospho-CoA kinase